MTEAQLIPAKYIFLDIVSYSAGRSVEAQTDIIATLNKVVCQSVAQLNVPNENLIYLPTGDGICIALLGMDSPYDIHIQLGLAILSQLQVHNEKTTDEMRKFKVRIGVNANVDNMVTDINGKRNVAGAGINLAQRIMNAGDGNQIFVGDYVFETVRYREKYIGAFRSLEVEAKHGVHLKIHQLIRQHPGLNVSLPTQFKGPAVAEPRLTRIVAYYFAHAIRNREFLKKKLREEAMGQASYTCIVLLYMLACDSASASRASELNPVQSVKTWGSGKASLTEQFEHYDSTDFNIICDLAGFIESYHFRSYSDYFESAGWGFDSHFISKEGMEKLRGDFPKIWDEFGFTATT